MGLNQLANLLPVNRYKTLAFFCCYAIIRNFFNLFVLLKAAASGTLSLQKNYFHFFSAVSF